MKSSTTKHGEKMGRNQEDIGMQNVKNAKRKKCKKGWKKGKSEKKG
jgi:hypothetical protein